MNKIIKKTGLLCFLVLTVLSLFGAEDAAGAYLRKVKEDYFADYPDPRKMSKLEKAQWRAAEKAVSAYIEFLHRTQKKNPNWGTGNDPDHKIYKPQYDKLQQEYKEKWQHTNSLAAAYGMETALLKLLPRLETLPQAGKFPSPELINFNHLSCYDTEATRKVMLHIIANPAIRKDFKILFFRGLCYFENRINYPRELLFAVAEDFINDNKTPFWGDCIGIPFAKSVMKCDPETKIWTNKVTARIDYYTYPGTPRNQFLEFLYYDFCEEVRKKLSKRDEKGMEAIEEKYYRQYLAERETFAERRDVSDLLAEYWRWDEAGGGALSAAFADWELQVEIMKKTPRGKENFFDDTGEDVPFANVLGEYMCGYMTACGADSKFREFLGRKYLDALNAYLRGFASPAAGSSLARDLEDARMQMLNTVDRIFADKKLEKTNLRFREYNQLEARINNFQPETRPVPEVTSSSPKEE